VSSRHPELAEGVRSRASGMLHAPAGDALHDASTLTHTIRHLRPLSRTSTLVLIPLPSLDAPFDSDLAIDASTSPAE
jgi:hypothetical protein